RLLELLQADASLSVAELAKRVSLSSTPCWRRVRNLEETGVIQKRVALLDRNKMNLPVTVFCAIKTNQHDLEWLDRFARVVRDIPEVAEFYRMSGDTDYLIKIVVPDIDTYDQVYKKLISSIDIYDVSSSFAMEQLKYTTALPVSYAS
ncbi:MAG: Lrp/AsnC family transcriptional regulator, partial [Gammaproteobacteria bacterium]|nr:Lrp/AsnC family transcriptional regulator [Gammaproteobacteria bacterium]